MSRTVLDFIHRTEWRFRRAKLHFGHGTDNALDEAAWLVGSALGLAPQALEAHLDDVLSGEQQKRVHALAEARIATRKPLAYLLNEAWFAGLRFYVDERVIVPRSLTGEFILERFAPWIRPERVKRALDLCTGSGCIAIALAHAFPQARVDASDLSPQALEVARLNVERHAMQGCIRLICSDLFEALGTERYDLIVSNPPYVSEARWPRLPPEYRHEPTLALTAGADGLVVVRRLLAQAADHLAPGGILVVEVGDSRETLERAYPTVPFVWLTGRGGEECVFLLEATQLERHHARLAVPPG